MLWTDAGEGRDWRRRILNRIVSAWATLSRRHWNKSQRGKGSQLWLCGAGPFRYREQQVQGLELGGHLNKISKDVLFGLSLVWTGDSGPAIDPL